jgi:hypothetical protein
MAHGWKWQNPAAATQGDEGAGAERGLGGKGKTLRLLSYKENRSFFQFSFDFAFAEFCSLCHFEFFEFWFDQKSLNQL